MSAQSLHQFQFPNGLTLLVEEMPDVRSAAFSLMVPAGSIHELSGKNGTSAALCDLMIRGAGERDSRALSAAMDTLGVQAEEQVGWNFLTFSGACLGDQLAAVLPLYADILLRPHLPEDQLSAVMSGIEQSLLSRDDEPQSKVLVELRRRCYDSPWNRPNEGLLSELEAIDLSAVRQLYKQGFRPNGAIFGVSGNVVASEIRDQMGELFGNWPRGVADEIHRQPSSVSGSHLFHDSQQTHIGLAFPAVPFGHPDYYAAWAAVSVLSGGSSSRLFTEVRERRALCYSVYASLNSLLTEGRVFAYAGTTAERAQETLDVMLHEIRRLGNGIEPDELRRCQNRAKSSLIMQQESTSARASALTRDWFHLGRIVPVQELRSEIEALSVSRVLEYLREHPARDFSLLAVGPKPLQWTIDN